MLGLWSIMTMTMSCLRMSKAAHNSLHSSSSAVLLFGEDDW